MKRPNVLLLYTDQQRWDALHCAGYDHMHTPNLDALAARGALFTNAFCNSPVCMPSRQSMLSGLYPSALGCTCNGIEMRDDVETLHKILGRYGYHTANIGKLHFKNHAHRDHREPHPSYGFDTLILSDEPGCYDDAYIKWVEMQAPGEVENCRCSTPPAWDGKPVNKHPRNTHEPYLFEGPEHLTHTAFVAEETISFLQSHKDQPFFCIAGFYAPHCPLNPPARFLEMYDPASLPLPRMNENERQTFGLSDEEWLRIRAYYYALTSHVDDQVGRILKALDDNGLRDNTIVVFTSDHGEHLGDHGTIQKGAPGLDSCAHVPLIVAHPDRVEAGKRWEQLIEAVDLAPTILDFCGVQVPPAFQGRSFRPLLETTPYVERTSVYIEHRYPFESSWKTIRTHEFKYAIENGKHELLYDLKKDPDELRNVAQDPAYVNAMADMRQEMLRRWFEVESQYPLRTGAY